MLLKIFKQNSTAQALLLIVGLPILTLPILSSHAQAATPILSDDFTDASDANSAGWHFYGASEANKGWTIGSSSGKTMANTQGSARYSTGYKQFKTTTLKNIGDSITVSLDLRTASQAGGGLFILALMHCDAELNQDQFGVPNPFTHSNGYGIAQSIDSVVDGIPGLTSPIYQITTGMTRTDLLTISKKNAINTNTVQNYSLTISRVASGIKIQASINGIALDSYIDKGSTAPQSFNTIRLYTPLGDSHLMHMDNINVSAQSTR
jgi:hypothetical protein